MRDPSAIVWEFQQTAPVDLAGLASSLGIPVWYKSMPNDVAGKIERTSSNPLMFAITVNSDHHPNRQRFTLAHEIAHYLMHRDLIKVGIIDSTMYRSSMSNFYEVQANRKAADILMPPDLVRREWAKTPHVSVVADRFHVSHEAMRIRAEALGLKTPSIGGVSAF